MLQNAFATKGLVKNEQVRNAEGDWRNAQRMPRRLQFMKFSPGPTDVRLNVAEDKFALDSRSKRVFASDEKRSQSPQDALSFPRRGVLK